MGSKDLTSQNQLLHDTYSNNNVTINISSSGNRTKWCKIQEVIMQVISNQQSA